tara:strand:- start:63 stop:347 length:285 start_codon:yes stop_codon:yes gene_type:complete
MESKEWKDQINDASAYMLPEPSWVRIAEIAIALLEGGTSKGKQSGREIVRDMGQKLADLREAQIERVHDEDDDDRDHPPAVLLSDGDRQLYGGA